MNKIINFQSMNVFQLTRNEFIIENVVRILLNPMLDTSGVLCSKVPTSICRL